MTLLFLATAVKTSWLVRHNLEFGKNLIVVIPGKRVSVETRLLHYAKELVLVNFAVTIPVSLVNHFLKYIKSTQSLFTTKHKSTTKKTNHDNFDCTSSQIKHHTHEKKP